jgi:hypothetical protein
VTASTWHLPGGPGRETIGGGGPWREWLAPFGVNVHLTLFVRARIIMAAAAVAVTARLARTAGPAA